MKHKKQMLTAGVLTAAILGGGFLTLNASAESASGDESLASKIATKFNLNKDEVQSVLNEHRTEQRAQHMQDHMKMQEERLTQAVADGKITEEQKTKILDYLKSQDASLQNLENKTEDERRAEFKTFLENAKKWAKDNGIDEQYVVPGGMMGPGHGHMGMKGGMDNDQDDN